MSTRATVLVSWLVLAGACRDEAASSGPSAGSALSSATCERISRLPGESARVRQFWSDTAAPVDVPVPCGGAQCLRVVGERIAVFQPDGRVWVASGADPDGRVVDAHDAGVPPPLPRADATTSPPPPTPPTLPPSLRTCGQTFAGGGIGWHVIRNRDDVWQRIAWVVPPTLAAVRDLPEDAYPLAMPSGALCGWGRQRADRQWTIHHAPTGQTQDAIADREHAPARCRGDDGTLTIDVDDGIVVIAPDGQRRLEPSSPPPRSPGEAAVVDLTVPAQLQQPRDALRVRRTDGTLLVVPLRDDVDLDQTPLVPGTTRARLATAGDGKKTLVVTERLQLPDCAVRERVFVVDVATGAARRIVDDDVVVLRLSFAAGRFVWLQAEPAFVDTSG